MAGFGGFLQGLGQAYGNNLLVGAQLQDEQANVQLKQQQIAQNKMSMAAAAQKQQTQKDVGAYIASQQASDASNVTDPVKAAKLFENASGIAARNGDFDAMETMGALAKGKLTEAKDAAVVQAQQTQLKKEDLANTADDYITNPTTEGARDLAQKAVAAGVNPTTIPAPGTPQFATWATQQRLASKDAAQKADFAQKASEAAANREEKRTEHADSMAERLARDRQTAAIQSGMLDLRRSEAADRASRAPTTKDVGGNTYEWDPSGRQSGDRDIPDKGWVKIGGPKQTATMQQNNNAIVASASEGVRGLRIVGAMKSDQTAGPFAGLSDGTILTSLGKTGTNTMTPADMQIYHTATAGMGLEIARTMTLGGGRGANQATINEMQHIIESHPGDTKATAVFKYANAADIIRNRLSTLPDTSDPRVKAQRQEIEETLAKIPTPNQVLSAISDPKERQKLLGAQESMANAVSKITASAAGSDTSLPGGADPGAGTNVPPLPAGGGLPDGWSVKEH